jgi:hypothetical protein
MSEALPRTLRAGAGLGALLAGWFALDSFRFSALSSRGSGGLGFFVFWGLPLAAAALFLAWVALRSGNSASWRVARSGCFGAALLGGGAFALLLATPLVLSWDALRAAVAAVQFAPLAGMLGGLFGLWVPRMRKRRR